MGTVVESLKILREYTVEVFRQTFGNDLSLISDEFVRIMNHKEDRKKYLEAVGNRRNGPQRVELSTGEILIVT